MKITTFENFQIRSKWIAISFPQMSPVSFTAYAIYNTPFIFCHSWIGANPCESLQCGPNQECDIDRYGIATCICPPVCEPVMRPVCGDDGHTYHNDCDLHRKSCLQNRQVVLAYRGECGKLKLFCFLLSNGYPELKKIQLDILNTYSLKWNNFINKISLQFLTQWYLIAAGRSIGIQSLFLIHVK